MKKLIVLSVLISLVVFTAYSQTSKAILTDSLGNTTESFVLKPNAERGILFPPKGQPLHFIRDPKSRELISPKTLNFADRHPVDKMPVLIPFGKYPLRVYKPDTSARYSLRVVK